MLINTITLTTITMISIFFIKNLCLYTAKSSIVNNFSFSVADVSCVVLILAGKSSIAFDGPLSVTIDSCTALTFPKNAKVLLRYIGYQTKIITEIFHEFSFLEPDCI